MAEQTSQKETGERWLKYAIVSFRSNLVRQNVGNTGALDASLRGNVIVDDAELLKRIEIIYRYYGKFLDMGVGKGRMVGSALAGIVRGRNWIGGDMEYQVTKLWDIMATKYGTMCVRKITDNIPGKIEIKV